MGNHEFGDPFVGQRKVCQCIPRIYGDHGFHFDLRGDEGNEIVTITDGGETRTYHLSTSWKAFSASNANIVIRFTNDMGSNDVFIRSKTPADIRSDELFGGWKCGWKVNGESIENHRCELVRQGGFYWKADYQIEFKRSTDNLVQEKAPGVGGWGGSCTCPDGSVYQVGDNFNHCGSMACIGGVSGLCNRYHGEWSYRKVTCGVPVKTEEIEYKLFPGAKCGSGFEPITSSWQDCEKAGKAIGLTGDAVAHVAYNYPWGTERPQGCFRSNGNNRIHFNRQAGGNAKGNDRILCKSDITWHLSDGGKSCAEMCASLSKTCVASELWPQSETWIQEVAMAAGQTCSYVAERCDMSETPLFNPHNQHCFFCNSNGRHMCERRFGDRQRLCPCQSIPDENDPQCAIMGSEYWSANQVAPSSAASDAFDCQRQCQDLDSCFYWVYNGQCHLHGADAIFNTNDHTQNNGYITGPKFCDADEIPDAPAASAGKCWIYYHEDSLGPLALFAGNRAGNTWFDGSYGDQTCKERA